MTSMIAIALMLQAQDYIVMRRTISPAQSGTPAPTPTPSPTPTPAPSPTPSPIPSPAAGTWQTGDWTWPADAPLCADAALQQRTVSCVAGGQTVEDSRCSGQKPAATRQAARYQGCSYDWVLGNWGPWADGCSQTTMRERTVQCQRTGGTSQTVVVADEQCGGNKPATQETGANLTTCGYSWKTNPWGDWSGTCDQNATRTRTVYCQRSDGQTVDDSFCPSAEKPQTVETGNYQSCTYSWDAGAWGGFLEGCSLTATRTRAVTCRRSDGGTVGDEMCANAGDRPSSTMVGENYAGCPGDWITTEWGPWSSTCSATATRTRGYACVASINHEVPVNLNKCDIATAPSNSETAAVYSGCTYEWVVTGYGNWSNGCTATSTRTVQYGCRRSNGDMVDDSVCTGAGKPKPSGSAAIQTGCNLIANGDFNNGLAGYYGVQNATVVDVGGNKMLRLQATNSSVGAVAYDIDVVNGKQYSFTVKWVGDMGPTCSRSSDIATAIWRFPNGLAQPAQGGFVADAGQICRTDTYPKSYVFQANYTGKAQIVLWLASNSGAIAAYVDELTLRQLN